MKKIFLILAISLFVSCSNDEQKDCDCDKVVETNYAYFGMPGGGGWWAGNFVTINECSGIQKTWAVQTYGRPKLGDCK